MMDHTPEDMAQVFRNCARMIRQLRTFPTAPKHAAEFERQAELIAPKMKQLGKVA